MLGPSQWLHHEGNMEQAQPMPQSRILPAKSAEFLICRDRQSSVPSHTGFIKPEEYDEASQCNTDVWNVGEST